jgi:hypothetical protein
MRRVPFKALVEDYPACQAIRFHCVRDGKRLLRNGDVFDGVGALHDDDDALAIFLQLRM